MTDGDAANMAFRSSGLSPRLDGSRLKFHSDQRPETLDPKSSDNKLLENKLSAYLEYKIQTSRNILVGAQSCLILCDPMDCSPPGSSVRGIFQARMLEWVAISSSRASSQLRV